MGSIALALGAPAAVMLMAWLRRRRSRQRGRNMRRAAVELGVRRWSVEPNANEPDKQGK